MYGRTCMCCDSVFVVILGREISGKLDTLTMTSFPEIVPAGTVENACLCASLAFVGLVRR